MSQKPAVTPVTDCMIENLGFTEGPLWTGKGTLMVVGMSRGVFHEIDVHSGRLLATTQVGGTPSGLAQGADGAILVAQGGKASSGAEAASSIQCVREGRIMPLWFDFHAPNDLCLDADGCLWFTDPQGPAMEGEPLPGRLWRGNLETHDLELVRDGLLYPNGLAFTPDDGALVVAETARAAVTKLADGGRAAPEPFIQMTSGRPDGMAFDVAGNLYVAATSDFSVQVFSPAGVLIEVLQLPEGAMVTNVAFGGEGLSNLFITSPRGGRVYRLRREIPGLPLH